MSGFSDNELKQAIIDKMNDNTVAIFGSVDGARIYAKLRGCTAEEMGFMMGSIRASLNRQIEMVREQVLKTKGGGALNAFIEGMKAGQRVQPTHEGMRLKELGERDG